VSANPYRVPASTRVDAPPSPPRRWGLTRLLRLLLRLGYAEELRRQRRIYLEYRARCRAYDAEIESWKRRSAVIHRLRLNHPELQDDLRVPARPVPPCFPNRTILE
jgi:hypothetical protein